MYQNKKILGVITARGGSKGIPGKNIKLLLGKPLIAYSIEAAKNSQYLDRCIVSTDYDEIIEAAKKYGADVPFKRPDELAQDDTPHLPVMQHAIKWVKDNQGEEYDYAMILQPTSPLRTGQDIDNCIKKIVDTGADSVISMMELLNFSLKKMKKIENDLILPLVQEEGPSSSRRQQLEKIYKRNAAIYLTKTEVLMAGDLFGKISRPYIMPEERSLDIDHLIDFEMVEFLLAKKQGKIKILNLISNFSEKAGEILAEIGETDYLILDKQGLLSIIGDYDVLVIGLGLVIDKEILAKAQKLKVIAIPATGLDHIDLEMAKQKGIEILSLRGEADFLRDIASTAELALGLMLGLARKIPFAFDEVRKGLWQRENFWGFEMKGKTLGIVGLGRLGKIMAKFGNCLGMKVLAFDPCIEDIIFAENQAEKVDFSDLLTRSDFISLHLSLNKETENLLGEEEFLQMKPSAFLINTSRGKIINEDVLLWALENKKIAGYAGDVLSDEIEFGEDCSKNSLVKYSQKNSNVILTPHLGGLTFEAREATDIFLAKKLKQFVF